MQKEQEHGESVVESLVCPSFSTYSSNTLNDIADQVTREEHHHLNDNDGNQNDFEFLAFRKAADGVFFEGSQNASQVFPIFNRDLLAEHDGAGDGKVSDAAAIRIPFGKLLIGDEERGPDPSPSPPPPPSTSSSSDDLEEIPAGTYCVWTPKSVKASPNRCKKSNSTGSSSSSSSSKRWKLLSLLRRSKSDGKESIVLLTPSSSPPPNAAKKKGAKGETNSKEQCAGKKIPAPGKSGEKKFPASPLRSPSRSPYEALYGGKREIRRKSYLPYKQGLVGFCISLNSIGRGFPLHV